MRIDYYLNGTAVNPVNRRDISLQITHDQTSIIDKPQPHVGIDNLNFSGDDVKYIRSLFRQNPGITEGIPFEIVMREKGIVKSIKMYIDLVQAMKNSRDGISAALKMLQSMDWVDDRVDAFTLESMYNEAPVPVVIDGLNWPSWQAFLDAMTIYIPYVISTKPDWQNAFMAIFGMTYICTQLYQTSKSILQWSTPQAGIGLVLGIAQLVMEIAYAILLIITLVGLITQLIDCLVQPLKYHGAMLMSDLLKVVAAKIGLNSQSSIWDNFPFNQLAYLPEKFNPTEGNASAFSMMGISVSGFGTRGYTSPGYAPSTPHTSQTENIQHGYFNGTGGDFLRFIKRMCNGKITIPDGSSNLVLERRDFYPVGTPFRLPDLRQDWSGYNLEELNAVIEMEFQTDLNDKNSVDHVDLAGNRFYKGTYLQATHQQITTTNNQLVCLKGLRRIQIEAARGVAKDKLTVVEQAVKDLQIAWHIIENIAIAIIDTIILSINVLIIALNIFIAIWNIIVLILHAVTDVINVIIDFINAFGADIDEITVFDDGGATLDYIDLIDPVAFVSLTDHSFDDRLNALLLENDMVSVPKVLLVDTHSQEFISGRRARIHADNATVVNTQYLWDKFYFIDAFAGMPNNRFTRISPALNTDDQKNKCALTLTDFLNLVSNSRFEDNFGEPVIAETILWYPEQNGAAEFTFKKAGWLADPENLNPIKRSEEIAINLKLEISIPNGQ